MNYKIIQADTIEELEQKVNVEIAENYKPIGGICHVRNFRDFAQLDSGYETYTQALLQELNK